MSDEQGTMSKLLVPRDEQNHDEEGTSMMRRERTCSMQDS
jgi:hypothetical protein